eukprot:TRINITY_DN4776_c0_g1_i3.p1 TRINITY_DN4776_c0_g1~~TRINITY_DN4776_c0_g1_i3.p1  ORF type:complete len:452 (+),score=28.18 TRINITY_DN4776_c0_g1_i3:387-1742(+)
MKHGGGGLLNHYGGSLAKLRKDIFPSDLIHPWKFARVSNKYWKSKKNRELYFDWLIETLHLKSPKDWDSLAVKDIQNNYGSSLLVEYNGSFACFKEEIMEYVGIDIHSQIRQLVSDEINQIVKEFSIKRFDDWYNVPSHKLTKYYHFNKLIKLHSNLSQTLESIYPLCQWNAWQFPVILKSYWRSHDNVESFIEWISIKNSMVTIRDIERLNRNSLSKIISGKVVTFQNVFDEYFSMFDKDIWKYRRSPSRYHWQNKHYVESRSNYVGNVLDIRLFSDWYRISAKQFRLFGLSGCFTSFGGTRYKFFNNFYSEYYWEEKKFIDVVKKSSQRWLLIKLKEIIKGDAEFNEDFLYPFIDDESKQNVELDIWIPNYRLAFEYQGEQHYSNVKQSCALFEKYLMNDKRKQKLCDIHGISLITIPYWWDGEMASLISTISEKRADVLRPELLITES